MPNKKLLIGGLIAVLLALGAYVATTPKEEPSAPVSREELSQEMQNFDFTKLEGKERERALAQLEESFRHMQVGGDRGGFGGRPGPGGPGGPPGGDRRGDSGRDSGMRKTMDSLKPEERDRLMEAMRDRFRDGEQQREEERRKEMEKFFEKTPQEQTAELDGMIDRMAEFEVRRKEWEAARSKEGGATPPREGNAAQRGSSSSNSRPGEGQGGRWGRGPDASKKRMLSRLLSSDSTDRAKRQEFFRRLAARSSSRKAMAAKMGVSLAALAPKPQTPTTQKKPEEVTERILVARAVKKDLLALNLGDPLTIANLAKPEEPPRMIVARLGKQIGEMPESKGQEYADYLTQHRHIWAKVLEVEPNKNYLLIEATVK